MYKNLQILFHCQMMAKFHLMQLLKVKLACNFSALSFLLVVLHLNPILILEYKIASTSVAPKNRTIFMHISEVVQGLDLQFEACLHLTIQPSRSSFYPSCSNFRCSCKWAFEYPVVTNSQNSKAGVPFCELGDLFNNYPLKSR